MNPADRRVKRTRRLLGEALIALTLEKGYEAVTIQEITDRADIGYRTFFRHYEDKDDLLSDVLNTTLTELHQLMVFPPPEQLADFDNRQLPIENGRTIFKHVQNNCDLYRVLLASGPVAMGTITDFACDRARAFFSEVENSPIPLDIVANHVVKSTFSLIRWWLDNDMPYPPEEMGEYSAQLIILPARQVILGSS